MIKGAIFDFDGTLFDSMFIWDEIGEKYIKSLGYTPEKGLREKFIKMSLRQAAQYYIDNYGVKMTPEEIMDGVNKMAEDYYFNVVILKPGVKDFLIYLKENSVKMCIATATDKYLIEKALERCGVSEYFSEIFTCNGVGAGKDSPLIYREALKHLGTDKRDTLVFEDAFHGAETAKKDGFRVAGIYDSHEKNQEGLKALSDIFINSFEDINLIKEFTQKI